MNIVRNKSIDSPRLASQSPLMSQLNCITFIIFKRQTGAKKWTQSWIISDCVGRGNISIQRWLFIVVYVISCLIFSETRSWSPLFGLEEKVSSVEYQVTIERASSSSRQQRHAVMTHNFLPFCCSNSTRTRSSETSLKDDKVISFAFSNNKKKKKKKNRVLSTTYCTFCTYTRSCSCHQVLLRRCVDFVCVGGGTIF